jgi:putative two-component system hydrogenase maturation factor HypX/HoxX
MRILFLTRSFNSLAQRLFVELTARGHEVSIEFDIADSVTEEAVELFRPDVVVAPFMKRAIPERVWRRHVCLIVHPGIAGDRGPSALDWAIMNGEREWGVTVLQAEAEMDAGPVWASVAFPMRDAAKSSLYRNEVTGAAVEAVLLAIERVQSGTYLPQRVVAGAPGVRGIARPQVRRDLRQIDWTRDDAETVLRKLRAADGAPGVLDELFGVPCYLFDARADPHSVPSPTGRGVLHPSPSGRVIEGEGKSAAPGTLFARSGDGVLRATADGAVRIGHCKRADQEGSFKLPVALAFPEQHAALPESTADSNDIRFEEHGDISVLHFPFYNGAMSTTQCERLRAAYRAALERPARAIVLAGGADFFSNGINLNAIEAAASPADESMRNIEAIDDVCRAIIETTDRITIAALQGNAGAGGCFLAFACDEVWARPGVLLNPHYKNMGNLNGSEYWTYTLPRRVKQAAPRAVMEHRLPISAAQAQALGLVDAVLEVERADFMSAVIARAAALAGDAAYTQRIAAKRERRSRDESEKPLANYRAEELAQIHRNFYGFDPSYHYARSHFVRKVLHSWTPRHLAIHRDAPKSLSMHLPGKIDR